MRRGSGLGSSRDRLRLLGSLRTALISHDRPSRVHRSASHFSVGRALLTLALLLTLTSCQHDETLDVRTDRAPLDRRLVLPSDVRGVRWVAVKAYTDSGLLEAPEKPYDVYAFIALDPPTSESSALQPIALPAAVARAILPPPLSARARVTGARVELTGSPLPAPLAVKAPGVSVKSATRFDSGLLLQLYLGGGS